MATTMIIDKTNLIEWLTKILEFVKKWGKVKIQVEMKDDKQKLSSEYKEFMKMIEEDMKKEGIKFEKLSFDEWKEKFLANKKKIKKIVSKIMK